MDLDSNSFRAQCPVCSEISRPLDMSLQGRVVLCTKCRKPFKLEGDNIVLTSNASSDNSLASPKLGFDYNFSDISQEEIDCFAQRFPNPPKGVWQVGEILLDGMCQVLPFSEDKLYAEGGVGLVQRVRRRDWDVDLIVKSPKPGIVTTEYGKESFERECQTWIELGLHPNIVSCYFVRRINGIPRLFAELAPDGTLNDWITNKKLYEGTKQEALARILDVSIQFAWGLEHAHRQGLLHLDVKPSNVMTSGSTIKVTDFGLSKFISESTETNQLITNNCEGMTPSYCSPEQFQAFQIYRERRLKGASIKESSSTIPMTKQSDIWSWAISVLAMFHGHSPCKKGGQTAAKVFEIFLSSHNSTQRPQIPQGMIDLLRWCFREKIDERPESMQTIADQIIQIYKDETGKDYPRCQPQNASLTAESFSNRAISLLDLGKSNEAIVLLNKAVAAAPNQPQIVFNRALALWRFGKINDAQVIQQLEELTQNQSLNPTSFYVFGLAHLERGNLKSCIQAFKRGLDIEPHRRELLHSLEMAQKLTAIDSQCITQYALYKKEENAIPHLYVEENGDFLLIQLSNQEIALIKTQIGQILATFSITNETQDSNNGISAVSKDYKWSLKSYKSSEIIVSSVLKGKNSKPKYQYRFLQTEWGAYRSQTIRTINKEKKGSSLQDNKVYFNTITVSPDPDGLSILDSNSEIIQKIVENEQKPSAFAVTPDGKWLALGGNNSIIRIWNIKKNKCVRTFQAIGGAIEALWFDPKKQIVISVAQGNICQIWNVALICKLSQKIRAPHLLCSINSSEELQERQNLFENAYKKIQNAFEKQNVNELHNAYLSVKSFEGWKSERQRFELLLERRLSHSSLEEVEHTFHVHAHEEVISTLAMAWNASFIVSAGKDCIIRQYSSIVASQHEPLYSNANSAIPFPTSRPTTWKQTLELDYHNDWVRSIALSPNNRFLITGSWDHNVYLWDLATGKHLKRLPEKIKKLNKLAFAPNGRSIATATGNGIVTLWDIVDNKALLRINVGNGYIHTLTFSRNGRFFVTTTDDSFIRLWNGTSIIPLREIGGFSGNIISIDISSDGSKLVAGSSNGKIYILDLNKDNSSYDELSGHLGEVNDLKLFPDGAWLVSTGKDKTIRFWDLTQKNEVYKLTSVDGEFNALALDYTGRTLTAGSETGALRIWNLYWNYSNDNLDGICNKKSLIKSLSQFYLERFTKTENSITSQVGQTNNFSVQTSLLITEITKCIYTELVYRGYHDISLETIKDIVESEIIF